MEFVYLNQIAGPKLPDDHREESSISVNSEVFVEMRIPCNYGMVVIYLPSK
jgi:hypothetical protein